MWCFSVLERVFWTALSKDTTPVYLHMGKQVQLDLLESYLCKNDILISMKGLSRTTYCFPALRYLLVVHQVIVFIEGFDIVFSTLLNSCCF